MSRKTVMVAFEDGHWTVRRPGGKSAKRLFATKSEAVAAAKAIARATRPSQVAIQGRDGRLQRGYVYGFPRIQRPPYRGTIGADQIERAVLKVSDMMGD